MFLNTKIKGIAVPFHRNFEEFNLRFYVRFKDNGGWKRGVVFIKEIVPKKMICLVAQVLYGEHYYYHRMKNSAKETNETHEIKYEWLVNNEWNYLSAITAKEAKPATENSEEEFITEHYWGYTKMAENKTSAYNVVHPKWNIHKVLSFDLLCNAAALYSDAFMHCLAMQPTSVFMADGSAVSIKERKICRY